jgi:hypothetical protein
MSHKTFSLVSGLIFLLAALIHVLRLAFGWQAVLGGWNVPIWVSWIALPIAGFLALEGFVLSRKS